MCNEFYEIKEHKIAFHVEEGLMIRGKYVKVKKLWIARTNQLYNNFINPLDNFTKSQPKPEPEPINTPPPRRKGERNESCCLVFQKYV